MNRYNKDAISTLTYFKGSPTTRHPEMVDKQRVWNKCIPKRQRMVREAQRRYDNGREIKEVYQ